MIRVVVDAGGTNLRVVIRDEHGSIERTTFTNSSDYDSSLLKLFEFIDQHTLDEEVEGIGISVAGSHDGQAITTCSNLQGWIERPLVQDLKKKYRCPVYLFNDAQAMGASEYAIRNHPLILTVWGSGVNFGLVLGDDIFSPVLTGPSLIGEGGHQQIVEGGLPCACGLTGCLEAYVGGTATEKRYGDPMHRSEADWQAILEYMAWGLRNVITLTGGRLPIYLTGGVACKQQHRLPALRSLLRPLNKIVRVPTISLASQREDAGLHGAACILERQLRTGRF